MFVLIAAGCAGLLGFGYYLQFVEGLAPCPMCIFQRLCYMAVIVVASIAALHNGGIWSVRIYSGLLTIAAGLGAGIAARQTWLQHLPADQVPECGPGLDFMLEMYPLGEAVMKTLQGTGECATVNWRFLTLSIAEWSLICFITIIIVWFVNLTGWRRTTRNSTIRFGSE